MKITNEAKEMIEKMFSSSESDCLKAKLEKSCCGCGTSIEFDLAKIEKGDRAESFNGISVLMEEDAKERAAKVTIMVENGELKIQDETPSSC